MSLKSIFFLGIISLINISLWFYIIISNQSVLIFLYLTILSFTISTFYLTSRFIYEILTFINKEKDIVKFCQIKNSVNDIYIENNIKLQAIKNNFFFNFINNKLSKFTFSVCITVCKVYWLLVLGGDKLMIFPINDLFLSIMGVYLHFCIGIFILIDMFIIEVKPKKEEFNRDLNIFSLFLIIYSIILVSLAKNFDSCVIYPFLALDYFKILAIKIVIYLNFRNSYQLYYFIHKLNNPKIKIKSKHKDSKETCDTDNEISVENSMINDFKRI
jgi:hypothetical protein